MPLVKIKGKYQITLPAEVRKKLNLEVGDYLELEERDDAIVLRPVAIVDKKEREAWEKLRKVLTRVHEKVGDVPEKEVERDVMEAIKAVRMKSHG